jgi:hypothetical protein
VAFNIVRTKLKQMGRQLLLKFFYIKCYQNRFIRSLVVLHTRRDGRSNFNRRSAKYSERCLNETFFVLADLLTRTVLAASKLRPNALSSCQRLQYSFVVFMIVSYALVSIENKMILNQFDCL